MAEPVTALTDYLLAIFYFWFGIRLLREAKAHSARYGAAALISAAVAALLGGTHHALHESSPLSPLLWRSTLICAGFTAVFLMFGGFTSRFTGRLRRVLMVMAGVKLLVLLTVLAASDSYRAVVIDYGVALAVLAICVSQNRSIIGAIAISIAAATIQQSRVSLNEHLNYNDLYHLIQIAAGFFFYRGFRRMHDKSAAAAPTPSTP